MFRLEAALPRDRWCSRFFGSRGGKGINAREREGLPWGGGGGAGRRKEQRLMGSRVWRVCQRDQIGLVAR